jgi:uncharacterized membrane protein
MIDGVAHIVVAVAAVGAGLNGGVFFAFSTFVMRALASMPAAQGMRAMQAINREAPSPLFMTLLFGTGGVCIAAGAMALASWDDPWAPYALAASLLYLICPLTTMAYHVPRNVALDRIDPDAAAAADAWARWHPAWTAGNHVRTIACLASAVTFVVSLRVT